MAIETSSTDWRGWARSSQGYAVRLMGRNDLRYLDELGDLRVFAEPTATWTDILVETAAIPDRPGRSREEVVFAPAPGFRTPRMDVARGRLIALTCRVEGGTPDHAAWRAGRPTMPLSGRPSRPGPLGAPPRWVVRDARPVGREASTSATEMPTR